METMKQVAMQLDDDGFPFAIVTGEQQPGQRKVIARFDGPGNLSKKERAKYAGQIVRAVNTFDQAREALTSLSNEVSVLLGLQEEELRDLVGHSNVGCLKERLRQAKDALTAMEGTHP